MKLKKYIRNYSTHIFRYLSRVFSFKLAIDERGINDALIFSLTEFCYRQGYSDILIYKSKAPKKEVEFGHDFDLYVECCSSKYMYFAIQAKVLNYEGVYGSFDKSKQQWEKLKEHEKEFKSKAFYMFYNGQFIGNKIPNPTKSDCLGIPNVLEYGIGIVDNDVISKIVPSKSKVKFDDFYPDNMDTFRKLLMCPCYSLDVKHLFSIEEIEIREPYELVNKTNLAQDPSQTNDRNDQNENEYMIGKAPIRIIVKKYEK